MIAEENRLDALVLGLAYARSHAAPTEAEVIDNSVRKKYTAHARMRVGACVGCILNQQCVAGYIYTAPDLRQPMGMIGKEAD
jgi:hypothetical protein